MRIIDLTRTLRNGMNGFSMSTSKTIENDGWNAVTLSLYSHAATHMDAPSHIITSAAGIGDIPVEHFMADCRIVDLTGIAPRSVITPDDLGDIRTKIRPGEGLLFRTGWSRYFDQPEIFRNTLPRLGEELVRWCIVKKIGILGVEPPSIADVNNIEEVTRIHTLLLEAGITIVEGLVNLDQIRSEKVRFIALPLKIEGGDGSPCRAVAIED